MWFVTSRSTETRVCRNCRHFIDDPGQLERELPGIQILSSAMGDTRGDQGLCSFHEQLLSPTMSCEFFWANKPG